MANRTLKRPTKQVGLRLDPNQSVRLARIALEMNEKRAEGESYITMSSLVRDALDAVYPPSPRR